MKPACYDTENCAVYCDDCAPDIEPEAMPQECDCPQNCESCGSPVEYSLTSDGVEYVMEHVRDALRNGLDTTTVGTRSEAEPEYYRGMPHCSIVGDWARDLKWYGGMSNDDVESLDSFIAQVDAAESAALKASS